MCGKTALVFATVLCFVTLGESTDVSSCKDGRSFDSIKSVTITGCQEPPCQLKRDTTIQIEEKFVPKTDVVTLKTSVHAKILVLDLPFIGVDGSDACKHIHDTDGKFVGCPLKAGTEYLYKNEFPVLKVYPKVSLTVHWALTENNEPIACFEVPSRIK